MIHGYQGLFLKCFLFLGTSNPSALGMTRAIEQDRQAHDQDAGEVRGPQHRPSQVTAS